MPGKSSYRDRLQQWLEHLKFIDDPFALYEADRERSFLPDFFVDRPYLHDVLGDPAHSQAAFLLAGRGDGKTATREMVAYECAHGQLRRRALAVRYYDFSPVLEEIQGDLSRLTPRHHVQAIVRFTLKALAEDVPPTYFDLLEEIDRALLMGYAVTFADPISRFKLSRLMPDEPVSLEWDKLTPVETLQMLTALINTLGQSAEARYQALYILVDRVDETMAGSGAAVPLLKPLVSEGPLLEMPQVAFKFFLPVEVGEQLQRAVTLRPDRVCIQRITWDEKALEDMIQQRLQYYSNDNVKQLKDLCALPIKNSVMMRLIAHSYNCPRTLLRLCGALIHHHLARTSETLISAADLKETLYEFEQQLEVELTRPTQASTSPAAVSPPTSGLHLEESGQVWINGQLLTPPLSELEFRLLKELYRYSPKIVRTETLINAVWASSASVDAQNLRKLITRLRQRLPGQPDDFVKNVRGQGYWLRLDYLTNVP